MKLEQKRQLMKEIAELKEAVEKKQEQAKGMADSASENI